jgi:hypothetical protein
MQIGRKGRLAGVVLERRSGGALPSPFSPWHALQVATKSVRPAAGGARATGSRSQAGSGGSSTGGEEFDEKRKKAEASKRIDELQDIYFIAKKSSRWILKGGDGFDGLPAASV